MIAIAISLLFGLAASIALVVVWLSVRSGFALSMTLLNGPEVADHNSPRPPVSRSRPTIFPARQDYASAGPGRWPRRAGA